jgi:hypothetical protein
MYGISWINERLSDSQIILLCGGRWVSRSSTTARAHGSPQFKSSSLQFNRLVTLVGMA